MQHVTYIKRLVALSTVLLIGACSQLFNLTKADGPSSCHLREFDLCMTSAIVFVQQPANAKINDAEIDKQCELFSETQECIKGFEDKCMTPMERELVEFMSGGILANMKEFCRKNSNLRKKHIKHGECVNKQRKNTNKCLIDFQAAIEKSTETDTHWKQRPQVLCCAMDRMRKCNAAIIRPACGDEAVEVSSMFIKGLFSRAARVTCDKYKSESDQCKALIPPVGTKPKGQKSTSVISKLMSTLTQA